MKDFYQRLGLPAYTDDRVAIEEAIASLASGDPSTAAARHVLLTPVRKDVYDRTHRVLSTVGQLRANLGLTHAPCRTVSGVTDFEFAPSDEPAELERLKEAARRRQPQESRVGAVFGLGVIVLIVGGMIYSAVNPSGPTPRETRSTPPTRPFNTNTVPSRPPKARPPAFTEPSQPLPPNGNVTRYTLAPAVAPLEIVTRPNAGHHFVKLVDWGTEEEVLTLFVREGQRAEVQVPLGTYELRYATGRTWYGQAHLFGPTTQYYKAEESFRFRRTATSYEGFTVELIEQVHGNLETERISPDQF